MAREPAITLDNATLAEIVEKITQLDPAGRYRVVIGRRRSREEILAEFDAATAAAMADPAVRGLSDDEIMDLVIREIEREREREQKQSPSKG